MISEILSRLLPKSQELGMSMTDLGCSGQRSEEETLARAPTASQFTVIVSGWLAFWQAPIVVADIPQSEIVATEFYESGGSQGEMFWAKFLGIFILHCSAE